jgi:hypothetical protein
MWNSGNTFINMKSEELESAKLSKSVLKDIRIYVAQNGGTIRAVLESGALWVMSKGAKEYIQKLKK